MLRVWKNWNLHTLLLGMQNSTAAMEDSLGGGSQNVKMEFVQTFDD